jgi:hypothetical protein
MNRKFWLKNKQLRSVFVFVGVVLWFVVYTPAQVCTPAPVSLVAWYEGENNLLDSRGGNNPVQVSNSMVYSTGKVGQAFDVQFASAQNRWDAPDNPNFNQQNLTLEAWIKTGGISQNTDEGFIASKSGTDGASGYEFGIGTPAQGGRLRFALNGGIGGADLFGTTSVSDNVFHHVAATYDGSVMKIYIDGVLDAQKIITITISYPADHPFILYRREYGGIPSPENFLGIIDELGFYNRALSSSEIQAIFNAGSAGKCKPTATFAPSGQVAWLAGDGSAVDLSGNGNNGALSGGAGFAVGKVGQGFSFNGLNSAVTIPDSASLDLLNAGTLESWIYLDNTNDALIYGKGRSDTNEASYTLGLYQGNLRFDLYKGDGSLNYIPVTTPAASLVGSWNHVAINWDAANIRVFVNGVQVASGTYAFVRQDTNYPVTFGKSISPAAAFSGKLDEVSFYNRDLSASEIQSVYHAGLAGKLKTANTPTGFSAKEFDDAAPQTVSTTVGDVTVTFQSVSIAGTTQEIPLDPSLLPALPNGLNPTGLTYNIATSAVYSGNVGLCFNLTALSALNFGSLRVYHLENGVWVNRTAAGNVSPALCANGITSLSESFTIAITTPTAANVSVGGRITDASGNAISRVRVSITNSGGITRTSVTNTFGFYDFEAVPVGETYIISVANKHYQFSPPTQIIVVNDTLGNIDFTGQE